MAAREGRSLLSRLFWASVGFGVMLTGFALTLSVFLVFIGVPLFVLGLALLQSQDQ
jgi:D-alanyl-lipoteichoic acid acyltransferase DltB (MBOAT superfamily)